MQVRHTTTIKHERNTMKKILTVATLLIALGSSAFAHHMAVYEDAGINIPEWSPHLLMEF